MDALAFFTLVGKMRSHQIAWYRHQKHSDLIEAKRLEKEVDRALAEGLDAINTERPTTTQQILFTEVNDAENNENHL